jgi:hypothetical protein
MILSFLCIPHIPVGYAGAIAEKVTVKVQFRPARFLKPGRSMNTVFMVEGK